MKKCLVLSLLVNSLYFFSRSTFVLVVGCWLINFSINIVSPTTAVMGHGSIKPGLSMKIMSIGNFTSKLLIFLFYALSMHRHSSIFEVSISAIFDLLWLIFLSYFPPL